MSILQTIFHTITARQAAHPSQGGFPGRHRSIHLTTVKNTKDRALDGNLVTITRLRALLLSFASFTSAYGVNASQFSESESRIALESEGGSDNP